MKITKEESNQKVFINKRIFGRKSKAILAIVFIPIFILCSSSCDNNTSDMVGSGNKDEVKAFNWSKYDQLIYECKNEIDQDKRNEKMYEAENMLLDTGAVIPIIGAQNQYLCKKNIDGFYISYVGTPIFKFARPKDGKKELKLFVCGEPSTFDAAKSASMESGTMAENYQGNLFRSSADGVEKELASDLKVSKDKLTYTVKIRNDAKWSDGVDVTAQDFEYTWRRASKEENHTEFEYMFEPIEGYPSNLNVESVDEKTLKIKLKSPCPYFKTLLAHSCYSPVRKDVVEEAKKDAKNDEKGEAEFLWGKKIPKVSCGAFTIDSWKHNSSIILKKNPKYVLADKVKVDKIHLIIDGNPEDIIKEYEEGKIDIDTYIPTNKIEKMKKRKDYYTKRAQEMSYIYFNLNSDIFKGMTADEAMDFRKAIGYAFDRNAMSKKVVLGNDLGEVRIVSSTIHDGTGKKYMDTIKKMKKPSTQYSKSSEIDKSRELLKKIGYKFDDNGKVKQKIKLEFSYNETENNNKMAECFKTDLDKLGIELSLKKMSDEDYEKSLEERDFLTTYGIWLPDYDDPMSFLELYTTNNGMNCPQLGKIGD